MLSPTPPKLVALAGLLGDVLSPRRAILHHRIAFALVEGPRFVFDPRAPTPFGPGWTRDTDLTVLLNASALEAWLRGTLDPHDPLPGELLLWAGEAEALMALSRALSAAGTALQLRAGNRR